LYPFPTKLEVFDREKSFQLVSSIFFKEFSLQISNKIEMIRQRKNHTVMFVSGHAGIGKTFFGKQMIHNFKFTTTDNNKYEEMEKFEKLINNSIFLNIDMNGGGDSFNAKFDDLNNPENILNIRVLARACFLSTKDFRTTCFNKASIRELSTKLKNNGFTEVNRVFEKYTFIPYLLVEKFYFNFYLF
jgi:hypothetical protein